MKKSMQKKLVKSSIVYREAVDFHFPVHTNILSILTCQIWITFLIYKTQWVEAFMKISRHNIVFSTGLLYLRGEGRVILSGGQAWRKNLKYLREKTVFKRPTALDTFFISLIREGRWDKETSDQSLENFDLTSVPIILHLSEELWPHGVWPCSFKDFGRCN